VIGRVSVAADHHRKLVGREQVQIAVQHRDDFVAVRYCEGATRKEVALNIDHHQRVTLRGGVRHG
jgi:hypothetical protein